MRWCRTMVVAWIALLPMVIGLAQEGTKKKGKDFSGKPLRMADFKGQDLENAIFDEANLFLAYFNNAIVSGASFRKADATSATFKEANLTGADLREAKLQSASFERANLSQANLERQDFTGASLQNADLRGANLRKVTVFNDITGADFSGADLRGAVLAGAKDYSQSAKFKGAKYDKFTRWHNGFNVEASGAVLSDPPAESEPPGAPGDKKGPPAGEKEKDELVVVNKPEGGPSVEDVKKALETGFWGPPATNTKQSYRYFKMVYGEAQEAIDPDGKKAAIYPINVVGEINVERYDGSTRIDKRNQSFIFYKDTINRWTFKFTGNNAE